MSAGRDELEVKARVDDPPALARALLQSGAARVFRGEMIDRRFDRRGALERRDEVLRLRVYRPEDGGAGWGELGWKGPPTTRGAYRHRTEWETRVTDPDAALAILETLGYEVSLRIDRRIEQLTLGRAVIRIEWYPDMDVLVEIEGIPEDIERAIGATGLPRSAFRPESLPYFLEAFERRTGRRARLAAEPA